MNDFIKKLKKFNPKNISLEDQTITFEEIARIEKIITNVNVEIDKIQEERKNQPIYKKVLEKTDFLLSKYEYLLIISSGLAVSGITLYSSLEKFKENPNVSIFYGVISLATAFSAGCFFERNRYK